MSGFPCSRHYGAVFSSGFFRGLGEDQVSAVRAFPGVIGAFEEWLGNEPSRPSV
jgi:hypothetical protein